MMDKESYLYDQRQLRLMLKKIHYYENNQVSLKHMLSSVESLAWNLNLVDKPWKERVSGFEGNLDYYNLNYNDENLPLKARLESKKDLDRLIIELKDHIKSKIDTSLSDEDVEYKY